MAKRLLPLILCIAAISAGIAQPPEDDCRPDRDGLGPGGLGGPPPPPPPPHSGPEARRDGRPDREKSKHNRQDWEKMSEEERDLLRRKAKEMHREAKMRVEQILKENGAAFTPEQREEFFRRYMQERRRIERTLREKMQKEREVLEMEAVKRIQAEVLATTEKSAPAQP